MDDTARDQMVRATVTWISEINDYPGWRDWKRRQIGHTLNHDDPSQTSEDKEEVEFRFSNDIQKKHDIVLGYLALCDIADAVKQCEYYFRRYPFRGLPVSRHNHIRNVCEMYFGRFYEFRTRLKEHLNAIQRVTPTTNLTVASYLKEFDREFKQEIRERNLIHHHRRFDDTAIDHVLLTDIMADSHTVGFWERHHITVYRRIAKEWARRARRRGQCLDVFLEGIAHASISNCEFLSRLLADRAPENT